jgi:excisionase family DNA binding protein
MNSQNGNRLTLKEASEMTGYHTDYLSQLIRSGKLRGEKIGRTWVTTRRAVTEYQNMLCPRPPSRIKLVIASTFIVFFALVFGWVIASLPHGDGSQIEVYTINDPLDPKNPEGIKFVGESQNYKLYEQ